MPHSVCCSEWDCASGRTTLLSTLPRGGLMHRPIRPRSRGPCQSGPPGTPGAAQPRQASWLQVSRAVSAGIQGRQCGPPSLWLGHCQGLRVGVGLPVASVASQDRLLPGGPTPTPHHLWAAGDTSSTGTGQGGTALPHRGQQRGGGAGSLSLMQSPCPAPGWPWLWSWPNPWCWGTTAPAA